MPGLEMPTTQAVGLVAAASAWYVTSTKFLGRVARSKGLSVKVVTEFEAGDE